MSQLNLIYIHLFTVAPCFFIGAFLLLAKKGNKLHRKTGYVYMILMFFTATITLFIKAQVGPAAFNHFGFLHLFSFLTLYSVPKAIITTKNNQIKKHKRSMMSLYFGAIIIAGGFTLAPGRMLHEFFFGL